MRPTLAAHAAVDVEGASACMWSFRDDLIMTAVRPLRISVRGALGCGVRL
jgi:hypothetical protein